MVARYDWTFIAITVTALVLYVAATDQITDWRTAFRAQMNELDSKANTRAIDSLLNYETVKYFGNEEFEARRYDESMQRWEKAAVTSQTSLSFLNLDAERDHRDRRHADHVAGDVGCVAGTMTIGDLVLVNAFMIQIYIPLNFLGVLYRESSRRSPTWSGCSRSRTSTPRSTDAPARRRSRRRRRGALRARRLRLRDEPPDPVRRELHDPAGNTVAVVGPSGAGKSTLSRLLFRFYDVHRGRITVNGQDIRQCSRQPARGDRDRPAGHGALQRQHRIQHRVRRPGATHDEIVAAAKLAQIHAFIDSTPKGYATPVGERGLKLSGGEKQRVAIARAVLKGPRILIFDEATSALDSKSEKAIQAELRGSPRSDDADDRAPALHDRRCRRDPGARPRADRRAGYARRASCLRRRVRSDVAAAADGSAGQSRRGDERDPMSSPAGAGVWTRLGSRTSPLIPVTPAVPRSEN
jgi:ATP-binding cassette subfamily B protein